MTQAERRISYLSYAPAILSDMASMCSKLPCSSNPSRLCETLLSDKCTSQAKLRKNHSSVLGQDCRIMNKQLKWPIMLPYKTERSFIKVNRLENVYECVLITSSHTPALCIIKKKYCILLITTQIMSVKPLVNSMVLSIQLLTHVHITRSY